MPITLDTSITRTVNNTIDALTPYSEINTKSENIVNDVVAHVEAQIVTVETGFNAMDNALTGLVATATASVNTSAASATTAVNAATSATSSATTATSQALSAATSAATATTKANLVTAVVIPSTATYSYTQQDWRQSMMSKAEFNAAAAERRANRAGSGFDEFGKHYFSFIVNDGMYSEGSVNVFSIGRRLSDGVGASKTAYPLCCVNGVASNMYSLNDFTGNRGAIILLSPAPTVLPSTATLTQQQIDSGVIKHSDASNSGLLVNGKFNTDTDTSGWTATGGTIAISATKLQITNGTSTEGQAYQAFSTVIGKKYTLEIYSEDGTSLTNVIRVGTSINGSTLINLSNIASATRTQVDFTATTTTTYLTIATGSTVTGETALFDNIAIFPSDAISRSDLVFLESWHEDVSEKDFVYPLGNVQYLGTTGDVGTTVAGAFAGAVTYSLFSDTWQADSALVGKGYVWSTLSDANKKAFVANPENNCYLDGDKVIQVRYRMRVVMGLGDSWNAVTSNGNVILNYDSAGNFRVQAKGKQVASVDGSSGGTYQYVSPTYYATPIGAENGLWHGGSTTGSLVLGYDNKCFAMPIALISRRNQGMMHPTYNPNGTKLASDSLPWYSTTVSFTSIADCFTDSKLLATSGYIGTTSGRDDGIFYDQVHEGDISDLRVNSKGINDYARTSEKWFSKTQDATYRGSEGEKYTEAKVQTTTGTVATVEVNDGTRYKSGDVIYIYDLTASTIKGRFYVKSISTNTLTVDVAFAKLANNYLISGASSTRTKSNTMTVYDVIGNPSLYPETMKSQNASYTSLHTAEDGTSLLPTGTTGSDGLAVYKLSRKANATPLQVLKSTDSGVTWTALTVTTHYTFSTTTNAITFTAGNIPLTTNLVRVTYQTHTNMAVSAINAEQLAISDVTATNSTVNSHLVSTLIGKIPTTSNIQSGVSINGYRIDTSTMKFSTTSTEFPLHSNITLSGGVIGAPAIKVFSYLTRSNGKAYLQLVFKEIKWSTTNNDWGDDSKFNIVDNVYTTTDFYGQIVLIGQKRIELPYFIAAGE